MAQWTLLARDANRSIVGVLSGWSLQLTLRPRAPGDWTLNVPKEVCPAGWPGPRCGLVMQRDGAVLASGNIEQETYREAPGGDGDPDPGSWELTGDTDLARVAYRRVYPDPSLAWTAQTTVDHYVATGVTETLLRNIVSATAGPTARLERQVSGLALGAAVGIVGNSTVVNRFGHLLQVMRGIAARHDGASPVGFGVKDNLAGGLTFNVTQSADLSGLATFTTTAGTATSVEASRVAPAATVVLLAGQGAGTARTTRYSEDTAATARWERREMFLDRRDTADLAELDRAMSDALVEAAETYTVTVEASTSDPTLLGAKVRAVWADGNRSLVDVVDELRIQVAETGAESMTVTLGAERKRLRQGVQWPLRRIDHLERAQ